MRRKRQKGKENISMQYHRSLDINVCKKNDGADYSVTGSISGRQKMDHVLLLGGS